MAEQTLTIINKLGLHARSASKLVSTSNAFAAKVEIHYAGKIVNGKSIMELLMLAAKQGEEITVRCTGKDENEALQAISDLVNRYFDEGE